MRKLSGRELVAVASAATAVIGIAGGISHAQDELQPVVVEGYAFDWLTFDTLYLQDFGLPSMPDPYSNSPGAEPGAANMPSTHANCVYNLFYDYYQDQNVESSEMGQTSWPHAVRDQNPINMAYGSFAIQEGATGDDGGFAVFPTAGWGLAAAIASYDVHMSNGDTIAQLINAWAPSSANPNALSNVLSEMGLSDTAASQTSLTALSATQTYQLLAAFSWDEGYNPAKYDSRYTTPAC